MASKYKIGDILEIVGPGAHFFDMDIGSIFIIEKPRFGLVDPQTVRLIVPSTRPSAGGIKKLGVGYIATVTTTHLKDITRTITGLRADNYRVLYG